jgi:hypothetical protein
MPIWFVVAAAFPGTPVSAIKTFPNGNTQLFGSAKPRPDTYRSVIYLTDITNSWGFLPQGQELGFAFPPILHSDDTG